MKLAPGDTFHPPIPFIGRGVEGANHHYFEVVRRGSPKKGEWFLSGAIVEAYKAFNDLDGMDYWIVKPTHKAKRVQTWARGEAVNY